MKEKTQENQEGKAQIAKSIIAVMKAVKGMEKNSKVGAGKSSYDGTKDQDVKEVFNKALSDNGLCMLQIGIEEDTQIDRWEEEDAWSKSTPKAMKQKQSVFTKVKTKYLLLHESGESIELMGYGHGIDPQDKGAGKATTYAMKNCLLYSFCTPVGKIDDSETTHSNDIATPQKKQASKEKPKLDEKGLSFLIERGTIENVEKAFEFREITIEQKVLLDKKLKDLKELEKKSK